MARHSSSEGSSLSWLQIFVLIAVFFFASGFFAEVLLLGLHHEDHKAPAPALRARYVDPPPPVPSDIKESELLYKSPIQQKGIQNEIIPTEISRKSSISQEKTLIPKPSVLNEKYGSGGEETVPNIVKAWRQAKLDWHQMLPKHNSIWERFGTPQGEGRFPLLVAKELQATDYLTRFRESGLAGVYGREHGALLDYSSCNVFKDVCGIHDETLCGEDAFCHWDPSLHLCVEGPALPATDQKTCPAPKILRNGQFLPVTGNSDCKNYIHEPVVSIHIDSESQTMFYHWWASWASIRGHWAQQLQSSRKIHILIDVMTDPMFFNYFGLISNNCWRRAQTQIPADTCFCDGHRFSASQTRSDTKKSVELMTNFFGLEGTVPPEKRVRIGLISRRKKRFILNEYELVDAVIAMGYECILLPLEAMTIYEQTRELRTLDVLIGIHGSALDNSVFLHKGSVMVQLLPYKVEHRVTFKSSAVAAGIRYMEWQLKDKTKAYFHWDLLDQADSNKLKRMSKDAILNAGQITADNRETVMFWINQDIIVPLDEWKSLVIAAVQASPASKRNFNIAPKQ